MNFTVLPKTHRKGPIKIKTFIEFFKAAQEKSGFFKDKKGFPYKLFKQQVDWITLFDTHHPETGEKLPARRALLGSRDKGKSEIVTILGTAWTIYNDPSVRIGIMSFKSDNAERLVNQVVKLLKDMGVDLESRTNGYYSSVAHTHNPTLMNIGLMTTIRGIHLTFLIMDDPLTTVEQDSKSFVERTRVFMNEATNISRDIILIGQLLTRNDLYYDAYGADSGLYYLIQSWDGDIPELDKDLNYLTKTMGKKDVARNYLGYIDDKEEAIFSEMEFNHSEQGSPCYAFIDPSAKGKDYTAVAIGWFHMDIMVIHGTIFKEHWGRCLDKIVELCRPCKFTCFENNHGDSMGDFLREKGIKHNEGIATTSNKIAKIYSMRGMVVANKLQLSIRMEADAVMQIKDWTETAKHDDMPDAMVMLVQKYSWMRGRKIR